ncbi:MAG: hypothetical protein JNK82_15145 [Myxococcaceae bacterium]|nr:hypothetical protein [Myxococcaceae bacterium]
MPCDSCGAGETLDPPRVMVKTRFPDATGEMQTFTAFCSLCGGRQLLSRDG